MFNQLFKQSRADAEGFGGDSQEKIRETGKGVNYWSFTGSEVKDFFDSSKWEANAGRHQNQSGGAATIVSLGVHLPHGAIITAVTVWGTDSSNDWEFGRIVIEDGAGINRMASATHNTEDPSVSDAVVDNQNFRYVFLIDLGNNDILYGGRITYTT